MTPFPNEYLNMGSIQKNTLIYDPFSYEIDTHKEYTFMEKKKRNINYNL